MTSFTDKQSVFAAIILFIALTGCDQSDTQLSIEPKFVTQTPTLLRNIPISNLSVQVSIDNTTKTGQGNDFPDGLWQIEFDLQPNQTYDIEIKWFSQTQLLLEETGQIFTDPDQQTITPELEFISAGYDRFDDDCDGESNLDEIIRNPNDMGATTQTQCADEDIVLEETVSPWVIRQHKLFQSEGITSRVTSYEQSVQIISSDPNVDTNFGISLRTDPDTEIENRARVDFRTDSLQGKQLRFEIRVATDFQEPAIANAQCFQYRNSVVECTIPYEWQEQQWYSVTIEETSETSWKATVLEEASEVSQDIGTIETPPNIDWYRPQNVLSYREQIPSEQCYRGLVPVTMRYKPGVANNFTVLGSQQIVASNCLKAGGGWSEGIRTIDDELVYTLTLGRS